jgi:lipoprotein NlpI
MKRLGLAALLVSCVITRASGASYDELNAGIAARNQGDWDAAILHFGNALADDELIPDLQYVARLDRGEAYAAKGNLDGAVADFTACIGLRPDDAVPRMRRATIAAATGKLDAARQDVDALIASDPADNAAFIFRARLFEINGDAKNQLKDLQSALANDPKNLEISFDVGIAEFLANQPGDAAETFSKLEEGPGRYEYVWLWLALASLKQGKAVSADVSSRFDRAKWPGPVMNFFQGHATEDVVNAAAVQGGARALRGQICEANFYIGEWRLLHQDDDGGKALLQKAAHDCPFGFVELYAAQGVLKNVP